MTRSSPSVDDVVADIKSALHVAIDGAFSHDDAVGVLGEIIRYATSMRASYIASRRTKFARARRAMCGACDTCALCRAEGPDCEAYQDSDPAIDPVIDGRLHEAIEQAVRYEIGRRCGPDLPGAIATRAQAYFAIATPPREDGDASWSELDVDTRSPDCPVRIAYVDVDSLCDAMAGTIGAINADEIFDSCPGSAFEPIAVIRMTELVIRDVRPGGFDKRSAEARNYQTLLDGVGVEHLIRVRGKNGYRALAYDAALGPMPDHEKLRRLIEDMHRGKYGRKT